MSKALAPEALQLATVSMLALYLHLAGVAGSLYARGVGSRAFAPWESLFSSNGQVFLYVGFSWLYAEVTDESTHMVDVPLHSCMLVP